MPFKANADRRHHIPRQSHQVTNWAAYDASLRQRGSLTGWFTDDAIQSWKAEPRTTRGGQRWYSPVAILTGLTLRAVFRLALRQTEGLIGSIIELLGLALAVPDHTTMCRRTETLEVPQLKCSGDARYAEPVHLLVDSTGVKLFGSGEWLLEKHGTKTRRSWRKLHIGMDADTGQIAAAVLTGNDVDDSSQVGPLLDQVVGQVASFTGHGAYDQEGVYASVTELHPEAVVIVPPRSTAVPSQTAETAPTQRDTHLQLIAEKGQNGVAEDVRVQQAGPSRGRHWKVQAGDRGRATLTHRSTPGERSEGRRSSVEPDAGAWTPELRPHHLSPQGPGVIAPASLVHATRSPNDLLRGNYIVAKTVSAADHYPDLTERFRSKAERGKNVLRSYPNIGYPGP